MCVLSTKTCTGQGAVGTGLCPPESPTVNARERGRAEPSALDFVVNSWPGLCLWAWPYPSNLNPQAKGVVPQVTLHLLSAVKEFLWTEYHWQVTCQPCSMWAADILPVGWVLYLLVASAMQPKNELSTQWHGKQMCRSHISIAYNLEKFKFSPKCIPGIILPQWRVIKYLILITANYRTYYQPFPYPRIAQGTSMFYLKHSSFPSMRPGFVM